MPDAKTANATQKGGAGAAGSGKNNKSAGGKNAAGGKNGAVPTEPPVPLTEAQQIQLLIEDKAGEVSLILLLIIFYRQTEIST